MVAASRAQNTALLAVLFWQAAAAYASGVQSLTVAGNGCAALEFDQLGKKYGYTLTLTNLTFASPACTAANVRVTKLYVQDSCLNSRDNNVALTANSVTCDRANNGDTTTCQKAFTEGSNTTLINATTLSVGTQFDGDNVCWNTHVSYIYVQNNCAETITIGAQLVTKPYAGGFCAIVGGAAISKWAIIGIVVAAVVVLALLMVCCFCCCCL